MSIFSILLQIKIVLYAATVFIYVFLEIEEGCIILMVGKKRERRRIHGEYNDTLHMLENSKTSLWNYNLKDSSKCLVV